MRGLVLMAVLFVGCAAEPSDTSGDTRGPKGAQGERGLQGEKGEQGARGTPGVQGPQGDRGPQGAQGPQGERGSNGANGATGATGSRGATGPQGPQGYPGAKGDKGDTGPAGLAGHAIAVAVDATGATIGPVLQVSLDSTGVVSHIVVRETDLSRENYLVVRNFSGMVVPAILYFASHNCAGAPYSLTAPGIAFAMTATQMGATFGAAASPTTHFGSRRQNTIVDGKHVLGSCDATQPWDRILPRWEVSGIGLPTSRPGIALHVL